MTEAFYQIKQGIRPSYSIWCRAAHEPDGKTREAVVGRPDPLKLSLDRLAVACPGHHASAHGMEPVGVRYLQAAPRKDGPRHPGEKAVERSLGGARHAKTNERVLSKVRLRPPATVTHAPHAPPRPASTQHTRLSRAPRLACILLTKWTRRHVVWYAGRGNPG